jgi:predicted Rossmann fold flavoprotein
MKKVAVIGAGAAGMMAAAAAAEAGASVTVFEKNDRPGKKIYITGKGRCNVTNNAETEDFFRNVCRNPKFLFSAVYDFDHTRVCDFFENNGCHLKVERGDRVFPVSDKSSDIIQTIVKVMKQRGVKVHYESEVTGIITDNGRVTGLTTSDGSKYKADAVIICTGGVSYRSTGSTGDGYTFAKREGINVVRTMPGLVPLVVRETWPMELQGLSLRNVSVRLMEKESQSRDEEAAVTSGRKKKKKNRPVYEGFGEMLFTHFGISGPLVLTASTCIEEGREYILHLNLKPALSEEQLDKRILRDFEEGCRKEFRNVLSGLFPSKMIPVMIDLSGIDPSKKVSEISHEERERLLKLTMDMTMTVTGTRGFNEAIITRGGVDVKDINPSTMETKNVKGMYFAGEVLDVDAVTGGFNLQIAWSTGHLAGESAAQEL